MAGEFISKEGYLNLFPPSATQGRETFVLNKGDEVGKENIIEDSAYYISAVEFYIRLKSIVREGWDFGSCTAKAEIWYWDEEATEWKKQTDISASKSTGWWGTQAFTVENYFSHNRGIIESGHKEYSRHHRWFVKFTGTNDNYGRGHWNAQGLISLGMAGNCANNDIYNPFEKGKLIYALEPTCEKTSDKVPQGGGIVTALRGTQINSENGKYVFAK